MTVNQINRNSLNFVATGAVNFCKGALSCIGRTSARAICRIGDQFPAGIGSATIGGMYCTAAAIASQLHSAEALEIDPYLAGGIASAGGVLVYSETVRNALLNLTTSVAGSLQTVVVTAANGILPIRPLAGSLVRGAIKGVSKIGTVVIDALPRSATNRNSVTLGNPTTVRRNITGQAGSGRLGTGSTAANYAATRFSSICNCARACLRGTAAGLYRIGTGGVQALQSAHSIANAAYGLGRRGIACVSKVRNLMTGGLSLAVRFSCAGIAGTTRGIYRMGARGVQMLPSASSVGNVFRQMRAGGVFAVSAVFCGISYGISSTLHGTQYIIRTGVRGGIVVAGAAVRGLPYVRNGAQAGAHVIKRGAKRGFPYAKKAGHVVIDMGMYTIPPVANRSASAASNLCRWSLNNIQRIVRHAPATASGITNATVNTLRLGHSALTVIGRITTNVVKTLGEARPAQFGAVVISGLAYAAYVGYQAMSSEMTDQ